MLSEININHQPAHVSETPESVRSAYHIDTWIAIDFSDTKVAI